MLRSAGLDAVRFPRDTVVQQGKPQVRKQKQP
jgi:hypothetical protein